MNPESYFISVTNIMSWGRKGPSSLLILSIDRPHNVTPLPQQQKYSRYYSARCVQVSLYVENHKNNKSIHTGLLFYTRTRLTIPGLILL